MSVKTIRRQHAAHRDDIGDLTTRRPLPGPAVEQVDPFLFLNHHGPQIYPPGNRGLPFGPHPHRGFETVTFILAGELTHRDSGVIGAVLTSPEVTAELIADGVHVDDTAMRLLLQAKGAAGVILISDGISATGMPDGKYTLGSFEVTVSGGVCRDAAGKLAGSTLTLDRALRNIVNLGSSLADALRMLTLNPATLLGIEFKKGSLRAGADADIVLLDEGLNVTKVWTRGVAA